MSKRKTTDMSNLPKQNIAGLGKIFKEINKLRDKTSLKNVCINLKLICYQHRCKNSIQNTTLHFTLSDFSLSYLVYSMLNQSSSDLFAC